LNAYERAAAAAKSSLNELGTPPALVSALPGCLRLGPSDPFSHGIAALQHWQLQQQQQLLLLLHHGGNGSLRGVSSHTDSESLRRPGDSEDQQQQQQLLEPRRVP
jgi:hypothetical protein